MLFQNGLFSPTKKAALCFLRLESSFTSYCLTLPGGLRYHFLLQTKLCGSCSSKRGVDHGSTEPFSQKSEPCIFANKGKQCKDGNSVKLLFYTLSSSAFTATLHKGTIKGNCFYMKKSSLSYSMS